MLERKRNFSTALDKTDPENDLEKETTKKWRVLFPIEKKHSTDLRKRAPSLTCKWWLIAQNPFSNQCSLKSYHVLETNESNQRNAFCGHCERGSGWSLCVCEPGQICPWILGSKLHSWSFLKYTLMPKALVFSFPFTLPPLWAALCLFDMWGSQGGG